MTCPQMCGQRCLCIVNLTVILEGMASIVITGCSSGFGLLAAKHFSARGDLVFATMRGISGKNQSASTELTQWAAESHGRLHVIEMDVTSDSSVSAAAEVILGQVPAPDVVINNAGQMYVGITEAFSPDELARQLDVNVVGVHRVTRAFLPSMRAAQSGLIINVSSVAGRFGLPFFGIYHASKWAVEGYSAGLRREIARTGVDVVVVEPGPFATELFGQAPAPLESDAVSGTYPPEIPARLDAMGESFKETFADPNAPTNPQLVVNVFEELIDMTPGTRPLRTAVGIDFGVHDRNASDVGHDDRLAEAFGMTEFSMLKTGNSG